MDKTMPTREVRTNGRVFSTNPERRLCKVGVFRAHERNMVSEGGMGGSQSSRGIKWNEKRGLKGETGHNALNGLVTKQFAKRVVKKYVLRSAGDSGRKGDSKNGKFGLMRGVNREIEKFVVNVDNSGKGDVENSGSGRKNFEDGTVSEAPRINLKEMQSKTYMAKNALLSKNMSSYYPRAPVGPKVQILASNLTTSRVLEKKGVSYQNGREIVSKNGNGVKIEKMNNNNNNVKNTTINISNISTPVLAKPANLEKSALAENPEIAKRNKSNPFLNTQGLPPVQKDRNKNKNPNNPILISGPTLKKKKKKKPKKGGFKFGVSNLLKNITSKAVSNLQSAGSGKKKGKKLKKKKRKRKSQKLREKILRKDSKVYLDYRFSIIDEDFENEGERKWNIYNDPDNISIEEMSGEDSGEDRVSKSEVVRTTLGSRPVIKSGDWVD